MVPAGGGAGALEAGQHGAAWTSGRRERFEQSVSGGAARTAAENEAGTATELAGLKQQVRDAAAMLQAISEKIAALEAKKEG